MVCLTTPSSTDRSDSDSNFGCMVNNNKHVCTTKRNIHFHCSYKQRPVFNNMSLLPGVKFASRGEVGPQGLTLSPREMLTPLITSSCEYSLLFRRMEGWTVDLYPWGSKFSPGTILKICHSQLMLNPWRYGLGFPGLSSIYYWGILRLEILQILWHHR
jgi:hypothetical protein